mgnify:CR=1 FL=1
MKYLLIANNDTDGIGQTVINLSNSLNIKGQSTKIAVLHKFTNNKNIVKIKRSFLARAISFLLNFLKKDFNELFWFNISTVNFNNIEKYINQADIIIVFTFHKIISSNILEKILSRNKLVYLRPLDMEMISGGCHFNQNCNKFKNDCSFCPKLKLNSFFNVSKKNLLLKKNIIEKLKPKLIVQNNFVKNLIKQSSIFKTFNPKKIAVGVSGARSKYHSKNIARKKLGIDPKEKVILFTTYNLSSYNKGGHLLKKSLEILEKKFLINKKSFPLRLLTLGKKNNFELNLQKISHTNRGIISSDNELNLYYRSADVLVSPSIYDFGPHVINESIANDLPVVAFKIGTAIDVIKNGVNGYLVPCFNTEKFAQSIQKIIMKKKPFKNEVLRKKIKSFRSDSYEAKSFVDLSYKDFKKINF